MFSLVELGVFSVLFVVGGITSKLVLRRTTSLVLQKFSIARRPTPSQTPTVEIVGRMRGLTAFVLSLMGFSPITRFTIVGTEVRCLSTSMFGQRSQHIPLRCVTNLAAGVHKPIAAIIWAGVILFGGVFASFGAESWAPFAIALLIAIALVVVYLLGKRFFIEVHAKGGPPISLLYSPNVIEGVPVDMDQALAVIGVIRDLVIEQQATDAPRNVGSAMPMPEPVPYEEPDQPFEDEYNEPTNHPDFDVEAAVEDEIEEELSADVLYNQARQLAQSGKRQEAVSMLREIVHQFPDSHEAQLARRSLQQVGIRE